MPFSFLVSLNPSSAQSSLPLTTNHLLSSQRNSKASSTHKYRSSSRKTRSNANTINNKSSSTNKGSRIKASPPNSALATSGAVTKYCSREIKKHGSKPSNNHHKNNNNNTNTNNNNNNNQRTATNQMMSISMGLTAKPPTATNSKTMKSVTESVMSYLHNNKDADSGEVKHTTGNYNDF